MSIVRSLIDRLTETFSMAGQVNWDMVPLIENPNYINSPDRVHSSQPLITSHHFDYFVDAMGLQPPDGKIMPGYARTYPDPAIVKKANGHAPLAYAITLHAEHEIAMASLFGPVTEMHMVIKRPTGSETFQLDLIHIIENDRYFEMDCNAGKGREEALPQFMAIFKQATANILADPFSRLQDSELTLAKSLRPVIIGQRVRTGPLSFAP